MIGKKYVVSVLQNNWPYVCVCSILLLEKSKLWLEEHIEDVEVKNIYIYVQDDTIATARGWMNLARKKGM